MVSWQMTASSPDGAIRFDLLPVRAFVWWEDGMSMQAAQQAAQQGGCGVSGPVEAASYLEFIARQQLGGATVSDVRRDEALMAMIQKHQR